VISGIFVLVICLSPMKGVYLPPPQFIPALETAEPHGSTTQAPPSTTIVDR
jgi:hypothetical protein